MKGAFYNENEPYVVEWLANLKRAGHIAAGVVDPRGIQEIRPKDLEGFRQAHFFAGLGGWSYALRLAGWPDDLECWTGSCPCQPWSQAGHGRGFDDERHIWPAWFKLIEECRPPVVFGEQVASPDGLKWLDLVFDDLEREGYAVGAADTCAAGVGAPHIRQRLYFVAVSSEQRREGKRVHLRAGKPRSSVVEAARRGKARELADAEGERGRQRGADARRRKERERSVPRDPRNGSAIDGGTRLVGDTGRARSSLGQRPEERFGAVRLEGAPPPEAGATRGAWAGPDWWCCRDGKARPAKPGAFPLADGVPARVGKLRAAGNAIVSEQAALFVRAVMPLI